MNQEASSSGGDVCYSHFYLMCLCPTIVWNIGGSDTDDDDVKGDARQMPIKSAEPVQSLKMSQQTQKASVTFHVTMK